MRPFLQLARHLAVTRVLVDIQEDMRRLLVRACHMLKPEVEGFWATDGDATVELARAVNALMVRIVAVPEEHTQMMSVLNTNVRPAYALATQAIVAAPRTVMPTGEPMPALPTDNAIMYMPPSLVELRIDTAAADVTRAEWAEYKTIAAARVVEFWAAEVADMASLTGARRKHAGNILVWGDQGDIADKTRRKQAETAEKANAKAVAKAQAAVAKKVEADKKAKTEEERQEGREEIKEGEGEAEAAS